MFVWMRSHMRKLMLAITILTIVAFTFLYNPAEMDDLNATKFATIYGRSLSLAQVQREARTYQLAIALGLTEYVETLDGLTGESDPGAFVFNTMIIAHEAKALGISPTDSEIADAISKIPAFQTNGQYDQTKYDQFAVQFLAPNGLSPAELEDVVRNSLRLARIEAILASAPTTSTAELEFNARYFQEATGAAVVFQRQKFFDQASASEADIKTFYDANTFRLRTPELRTAEIVTFSLPAAEADLKDKARIEALQKVANASAKFATATQEKSFAEAAKDAELPIETTLPFDASGRIVPPTGTTETTTNLSDPVVAKIAPTAFTLSETSPVSGVLQDGDSFHIINLTSVIPEREKTLEEATPEITADLRNLEAETMLEAQADDALAAIRADLAAGKSLADAVKPFPMAELKPFESVSVTTESASPELRSYAQDTVQLKDGEITGLTIETWGAYAVYLEKRAAIEEAVLAENRDQIAEFIRTRKGNIILFEWLEAATKRSGLNFPGEAQDDQES